MPSRVIKKQKANLLPLPIFILSLSFGVSALNVKEVRDAIEKNGQTWIARESPLTRLSFDEKKRFLTGALPEPPEVLSRKQAPNQKNLLEKNTLLAFPTSLDWRNKDGGNWISPVRNQDPYATCASFSAIANLESLLKIQAGDPSLDLDLSERFLFAYGGGDNTRGWWASQTYDFLMTIGVVTEDVCPYIGWDGSFPSDSASASAYLDNPLYLIQDWDIVVNFYIPPFEKYENMVKTALVEYPLLAYMNIYEDFVSYSGGVYNHVTGNYIGDHLVQLIGWDDAEDYWICKNSWGTDWGEGGFFRIRKSGKADCDFPQYVYRIYPRTSVSMRYYESSDVPQFIPDAGSLLSQCRVRNVTNSTDVTLQFYLDHTRQEDLTLTLANPFGLSSVVVNQRAGNLDNIEDLFLNDECAWSVTDFINNRDAMAFPSYRGCARPDNPLSSILYRAPYGNWSLTVTDDTAGETGQLTGWGLLIAADPAPDAADPQVWSRY